MNFKASTVPAADLDQDDRFKMAGQMYQIISVEHDKHNDRVYIDFRTTGTSFYYRGTLTVSDDATFKIYNQK